MNSLCLYRLCFALGFAHPDELIATLNEEQIKAWAEYVHNAWTGESHG